MRRYWIAAVAAVALAHAALAQAGDGRVKIGILHDASGPYSHNQGAGDVVSVRLALEDFGKQVLGKDIEVVFADHQNKTDVGSAIARRWYDAENVDVIMGLGNSAVALAVQQLAREKDKIDIPIAASASSLTGKQCSPNAFHWVHDTYNVAASTARALTKSSSDTWYFITVDYAFGHALEADARKVVQQSGGKVIGRVLHPLFTPDLASFLFQAQGSGAKFIGLANAGADTVNSLKQAREFNIGRDGKQRLAALLFLITDVHGAGLEVAQGLVVTEAFYWDQNDETRAFSKRWSAGMKRPPTMYHAGTYSAVMHYLKAVKAAGTDDTKAVIAKMRELPINDFMGKNVRIREDGKVMRDMYVFEVKKPSESKGEWDVLKQIAVIPAQQASLPASESECPLLKNPRNK
jgi:branched-chain amino acid transport system substrate-binding protein